MSQDFDFDMFTRRSARIAAHSKGKTFAQLAGEIEALRREFEGVRDRPVTMYIRRNLDGFLLRFAIDTSQSPAVVDRLYKHKIRQGFNDPHAEVICGIEYAVYCSEHDTKAKGLRALQKVRERIGANKEISPGFAQNALEAIDKTKRNLEANQ
jgi:hypothetical protein